MDRKTTKLVSELRKAEKGSPELSRLVQGYFTRPHSFLFSYTEKLNHTMLLLKKNWHWEISYNAKPSKIRPYKIVMWARPWELPGEVTCRANTIELVMCCAILMMK